MKATLTFDLPEEHAEFQAAVKGQDALLLIDSLRLALREAHKYDAGYFSKGCPETLQLVADWLTSHVDDYGLPHY